MTLGTVIENLMDIVRPTPFPRLLSALISGVSLVVERINSIFYKNWKMFRPVPNVAKAEDAGPGE